MRVLEMIQISNLQMSYSTYMGSLSTLLVWHIIDPVSEEERIRNNEVYRYQKNRNPFIDHPSLVNAIWKHPLSLKITKGADNIKIEWPSIRGFFLNILMI